MKSPALRIGLPLLGAAAALTMTASSAVAAEDPVLIREDSATGDPYSGNIRATNLTDVTFSGNSPLGVIVTTCTNADLRGSIDSDGNNGVVDQLILNNGLDGSGDPIPCTNNHNGTTTITAENLDGTGDVRWDSEHLDDRDGRLRIHSPDPDVKVRAVLTGDTFEGEMVCHYGLTETPPTPPVDFDLFNRDNPNRPVTGNNEAQGQANGQAFGKIIGESDGNCPLFAATNGVVQVLGESTPGSGSFDQSLYATPAE